MVELLGCPFCGQDAYVTEEDGKFYSSCLNLECGCALGEAYDLGSAPDHWFSTEEAAAAAWNHRLSAWNEAVEAAARVVDDWASKTWPTNDCDEAVAIATAIRALKKEG